jgi:hypothetical protein
VARGKIEPSNGSIKAIIYPTDEWSDTASLYEMARESKACRKGEKKETYGSPMTKLSPALMDGTRPKEPTRAAAPSLSDVSTVYTLSRAS